VRDTPHLPETRTAWLPAEGADHATLHEYAATVEVKIDDGERRQFEHLFRCTETGALRRWGVASP
jgi:hypothetical protein